MTFSLLGGAASGSSSSNATQSATVSYAPSVVNDNPPGVLVSPYPAGQGLATINAAYPASAAVASPSTTSSLLSDLTGSDGLLLLGALAVAFYFMVMR